MPTRSDSRKANRCWWKRPAPTPGTCGCGRTGADLYRLQGRSDEALAKYREAVARPKTRDPNDRARIYAYDWILRLLDPRDLDAVEALHKQRIADYGSAGCPGLTYARFLVLQRGDPDAAEAAVHQSGDPDCDEGRELRRFARYLRWANAKGPERDEALRRARAVAPVTARLLYTFAAHDRMLPVAKQLLAAGEKVDMKDNRQFNALGYALGSSDLATARRLLVLGARPATPVGPEAMPVALLPVLSRDLEAIRLLQRHGVDYAQIRFQGMTALEHARQIGDGKLLQVLDPRSGRL
jgi:hypothetical protein